MKLKPIWKRKTISMACILFQHHKAKNFSISKILLILGSTFPSNIEFVNTAIDARGKIIVIEPSSPSDPFAQGTLHFIYLNQHLLLSTVSDTSDLYNILSTNALTSTYLGKASIYGAIFSENKVVYECAMEKAMHRLKILTLLQYYRTQDLMTSSTPVSNNCKYLLNNTLTGAANYLLAINETLTGPFSQVMTNTLQPHFIRLDKTNNQLATLANCPAIY